MAPVGFFGADDLQPMLDDVGVPVTVGAVTANGIEDAPDEEMLRDTFPDLIGRVRRIRVKSGVFALARAAAITVDGTAYKIHSFSRIGDGAYTLVTVVSEV